MNKLPTSLSFRTDINGLRAYAVLAVLLFHFQFVGFSGGFFGVDIFFVISGFLMAAIVSTGLINNKFSLLKFYLARVRRIVPVLLAMLFTLLILGWFWLPTPDYKLLARQAIHAIFFISNIRFNRDAGYFDSDAHEKWTLHTWTLGVEFQFYILLPLLLMFLWKIKPNIKSLFLGLLIVFTISLSLSIYYSYTQPSFAFYLLPTRAWEFIAGALIFLTPTLYPSFQKHAHRFFILGFTLVASSFFIIDSTLAWPSAWALLPVLGTAFIILSKQENNILTAHPIAQWLGDRSYSIYLWHWPIVVVLHFANMSSEVIWIILGLFLSLLFGHLSYILIEKTTQKSLSRVNISKQLLYMFGCIAIFSASAGFVKSNTFKNRFSDDIELISLESENRSVFSRTCFNLNNKTNIPNDCSYNELDNHVYIIGDSHADAVFTALGETAEKYNFNTSYLIKGSCPTLLGAKIKNSGCFDFNNLLFSQLKNVQDSNPLIIVNRFSSYLFSGNEAPKHKQGKPEIYFDKEYNNSLDEEFQRSVESSFLTTVCSLSESRPVYLVRPIPELIYNVPKIMARSLIFGKNIEIKISLDDYHNRHALAWSLQDKAVEQCNAIILNPLPYLCDDKFCYGAKDGRPLYFDDDHLSEYGNKLLVPMFEEIFHSVSLSSLQLKDQ